MPPLHLGVVLPSYGEALDAEHLAAVAIAAEEAGFDSAWATDHLVVPPEHAAVYGTIAEVLVALGFLAGRTRRLELGVSALVVPQRRPLVALKQLTTLDLLSGGRIVAAVTAGWMEGEFATLGSSFEQRGRLLDEWLDLAASVFEQMPGRVRYEGRLLSSTAGWRRRSRGPAARSSGSQGCRRRRCGARRRPASGTRSRCRRTSSGRWHRSSARADRTAA